MWLTGLLAGVELGLNRVSGDGQHRVTAAGPLRAKVIAVECSAPPVQLFILPSASGLQLAAQWAGDADCHLRAPAASLCKLATSKDKTSILHSPRSAWMATVRHCWPWPAFFRTWNWTGNMNCRAGFGPVGSQLLSGHLRSRVSWTSQTLDSLRLNLADYLSEESRSLVGQREADARFAELDQLKLSLDRLDARIERLAQRHKPTA
jgi:ubiquinone biosynthesis accessory factor UbiJ